jgi:hypothetical protein
MEFFEEVPIGCTDQSYALDDHNEDNILECEFEHLGEKFYEYIHFQQ